MTAVICELESDVNWTDRMSKRFLSPITSQLLFAQLLAALPYGSVMRTGPAYTVPAQARARRDRGTSTNRFMADGLPFMAGGGAFAGRMRPFTRVTSGTVDMVKRPVRVVLMKNEGM